MRRLLLPVITLLATLLSVPAGLVAQESSPVASPETVACAATPRSAEELLNLWYDSAGTPLAASPSAVFEGAADLPAGGLADAATVAAIDATVQAWVACTNAGNVQGALSLLTDDLVRRRGPQGGASREETRAALQAPPIPPGELLIVGEAGDARVLPDGRVAAVFAFGDPAVPAAPIVILFAEVDGQWLIDDFAPAGSGVAPEAGTPTA